MKPFAYAKPRNLAEALPLLSATARPKAGGLDLLDLAKAGLAGLESLVEVGFLDRGIGLEGSGGGGVMTVGGGATLSRVATDPAVQRIAPALADAAAEAATPQVRNRATVAGNLLQRPRCPYFRDPFFDCIKRGGKTCPAMDGDHSEGAVLGNGRCCAVHPSNVGVALLALGAEADIGFAGKDGTPDRRVVPVDGAFFVAPEVDPLCEVRLGPGELILGFRFGFHGLPDEAKHASAYVEVDQKASFDWASASCAVALVLDGGKVASARVALGHVAPVPMLSEAAAQALIGKVPDEKAAEAAGEAAVKGATPLRDNAHKVQHLRVCVKRAVLKAAERGR